MCRCYASFHKSPVSNACTYQEIATFWDEHEATEFGDQTDMEFEVNPRSSELTKKRQKHIKSCRENNDHSHELIADQYSDPSRFVDELLQNADDAEATEVIFDLTSKALSISHNGKKLFDFADVESITTIGSSTKKEEVNKIGKFGAGFKSVFAITETPEIHSGDYHFQISDYIVPEAIEPRNTQKTEIILPFNHPDILPKDAYQRVSERLKTLKAESLLFLRHIKEIHWKTASESGRYSYELKGNEASLVSQTNEEASQSKYFLAQKNIKIENAKLNIVVAYRLDNNGKVVSLPNSKLFVFFPTEVNTGLKFLVHAPYRTTPSRETIPFEDPQNQEITTALASLIAESIIALKKDDLLTVGVLSILPIDSEKDHPIYRSAFKQVKAIFATESLLPTSRGHYATAGHSILARGKELTTLLEQADCKKLFNRESSWLSPDITYNRPPKLRDYLVKELDIPEITMEKFCSSITEDFIKSKNDNWVINFYSSITENKALYRVDDSYQTKGVLRKRPIIRLEDGSHICPDNDSGDLQVHLPSKTGDSKFKTVKRNLAENKKSLEFLKALGLKKPDDITEIKEFIIPKYQGRCIGLDEYKTDFERVLDIWNQSNSDRKKEISDLLKPSQFVRCVNQVGQITYQQPGKVYFCSEELSAWFAENAAGDIYFLDSSVKLFENSQEFLKNLGVRSNLKMFGTGRVEVHRRGNHRRSVDGFNPAFNIHGLKYSLENITLARSLFLWMILLAKTNKLKGYIETKTNRVHSYEKGEEQISKAMNLLKGRSWLYDDAEELLDLPINKIAFDDINDNYRKDHNNIEKLIEVLGFKLDTIAEFEKNHAGLKVVSGEDFELLQKIKNEPHYEEEEQPQKNCWTPDVGSDATTLVQDDTDWKTPASKNLSGQAVAENSAKGNRVGNYNKEENGGNDSRTSENNKDIGRWGEEVAYKKLKEKFPSDTVVWFNQKGNVGKGYDFVIRDKAGNDIDYYEIKTTTDESPQSFQISGTQWNWAKQLYHSQKGDMYHILVVSNAGTKQPIIREIKNPVDLWKSGKLEADPVKIRL